MVQRISVEMCPRRDMSGVALKEIGALMIQMALLPQMSLISEMIDAV